MTATGAGFLGILAFELRAPAQGESRIAAAHGCMRIAVWFMTGQEKR